MQELHPFPEASHVGIEVHDLFGMELFYRTVLGFDRLYRYVSPHTAGLRTAFLSRQGFFLELLERPRDGAPSAASTGHISLRVDDVDAVFRDILAQGRSALVQSPPRDTGDGFREASVRDPEGNVVELSARLRPAPRYPVRAVLFDFDGTLVDSEPNYYEADRCLLARYGIDFGEDDKRRYVGVGNLSMVEDLVRRFRLPTTPHALAAEKDALYLDIAERHTEVYPQMRRFLDGVRARGLSVAIASGSSPLVLRKLLRATGLDEVVGVVVSSEEVPRAKPSPDVFLEAARRLSVPAHHCLVVEDSRVGVEAALRGFMRCLAVPYLIDQPLDPTFALADHLVAKGMADFEADRALAWLDTLR